MDVIFVVRDTYDEDAPVRAYSTRAFAALWIQVQGELEAKEDPQGRADAHYHITEVPFGG